LRARRKQRSDAVILRFAQGTSEEIVREVCERAESAGLRALRSPESARPIVAIAGKMDSALAAELSHHPCVESAEKPLGELLLAARAMREMPSIVTIGCRRAGGEPSSGEAHVGGREQLNGEVHVGGGDVVVIAGPCSVEGRDAVLEVARHVAASGAHLLRGGAFKPRSSPYAFQGFGVEGLRQLKDAGEAVGLPVVSEIMDASDLPAFIEHDIDCLQIGARNMQNFTLLKSVARAGRPVLLKRGLAATVEEWLNAAEYLAAGGCDRVILCERGIRTFERATRNTLDLTVLPLLREWTHLPVIVDPAHAAGIARIIPPLSRASIAAGADGVAVEVHLNPSQALSDGPQALLPAELAGLVAEARVMAAVTGRRLHAMPSRAAIANR
jgi:3-deoxy-7-phosphoheptulonate synthase